MTEIHAILERIAARLDKPDAPELWSATKIAEWMGLSEDTISKAVVTRSDFPRPVIPTGEVFGQKRWFSDEVQEWTRRHRAALPKRRNRVSRAA